MSDKLYWESLNEMLRNEKIEFTSVAPAENSGTIVLSKLTIENNDKLKKAVQYAFNHPNEIAKLEYEHNNGQPIKITENHLDRARQLIESENCRETTSTVLDATGDTPLDDFLIVCYKASQNPAKFCIVADNRRKALISTIFGSNEFQQEISSRPPNVTQNKLSCTQIIFDSADIASAIDQLIMNLSDRTQSLWRIQSVYVQESLEERVHEMLSREKLNATNNLNGSIALAAEDQQKNQELAKRYGGNLVTNDINTVCLLFDVPAKYMASAERKSFHQIPIVINFFRTTKELIQLMRTDLDANKGHLTSIWTENIGLFYEMAAEIQSDIIWSNCIGLFDRNMPPMNNDFVNSSTTNNRFGFGLFFSFCHKNYLKSKKNNDNITYHFSLGSTINTKGKYALHILAGASNKLKCLYIPYGKTFAN